MDIVHIIHIYTIISYTIVRNIKKILFKEYNKIILYNCKKQKVFEMFAPFIYV